KVSIPRRAPARLAAARLRKAAAAWRRFGARGQHGAASRGGEPQLRAFELRAHSNRTSNSPAPSCEATAQGPERPFLDHVSPAERDSLLRLRRAGHRFGLILDLEFPVPREDAEAWSFRIPMARRARDAQTSQCEAIVD